MRIANTLAGDWWFFIATSGDMTRHRATAPDQETWMSSGQRTASKRRIRIVALAFCVTAVAPIASGHGDRSEYLAALDARIDAQPDSVPHLLERAEVHRRLGHAEEALADLDRVLGLAPGTHRVHYPRGLIHLDEGRFDEAESSLRRFLEAAPNNPSGRLALADALTGQGRHLAAAREIELAIEAQPTPVPDHFLARARAYLAAGEPRQAVAGLDEGMRAIGPIVALQKLAIEIELDRGNHRGAVARIDEVLAGIDRKETWLVRKAHVLLAASRYREAEDTFHLAREALGSLPKRIRSSPAMLALAESISTHLNTETAP